jgi:uncharacterized protein YyaL (SSP411 family)
MPNRLAQCSSPYLRQHAENPVDWFPWCDEAFALAETQDKPIFLSVGYSACHWCHVMEHESFENDGIATILNQHFVSIKVDREERPDVDQIYMQAVQMLTGSGGWPMSVFMTHSGQPFFGGTYWPPDSRWGRPGFGQVLLAVVDAWQNKREQIAQQGAQMAEHLQLACQGPAASPSPLDPQWIAAADSWLLRHHDAQHGGFGGAPKFPHAMDLMLWIELSVVTPNAARTAAIHTTLEKMARGGIYDHLGGGFARYSVDERWLVPHFEKMLYDNALLAGVYADAYRLWRLPEYAQIVRETLDYIIRDMTDASGAYYSTEDADSEGVEGKFYVWSRAEIEACLGPERSEQFCSCYDVTEEGNFEEGNILNLPKSLTQMAALHHWDEERLRRELAEDRARLLQLRSTRVRPGLDDKVLLSWNALMISAMVRGYRALGEMRYLDSARRAKDFLLTGLRKADGRLWHTWRHGEPSLDAYLDDYAYAIDALTELFQVDPRRETLVAAIELAETMQGHFSDPDGGFFFTADDHERLIARSKDLADSSVPSGNAMAASGLLTLARLTGREDFLKSAESALIASSGVMASSPQAAGQALRVLWRYLHDSQETVLVATSGDPSFADLQSELWMRLDPRWIVIAIADEKILAGVQDLCPLLQARSALDGQVTLYQCENFSCQQPLVGQAAVRAAIRGT